MSNPHLPLINARVHIMPRGRHDSFFEVACTCGWKHPHTDRNPTSRVQAMDSWRSHALVTSSTPDHA